MEVSIEVPQKTEHTSPLWQTVLLLGIQLDSKSIYHRDKSTFTFLAMLFTVVTYLPMDERIFKRCGPAGQNVGNTYCEVLSPC